MESNAVLFSNFDCEDGCLSGGLVFKVNSTETYEDAYNEVKDQLESPEVTNHVIEDRCLLDDLFERDETYKFIKTYWNIGLYFVFENSEGDVQEHKMTADFLWVAY